MKNWTALLAALVFATLAWAVDYSDKEMWVSYESGESKSAKPADVFFLCPTVTMTGGGTMDVNNSGQRAAFKGGVNQEKEIYSDKARFFAPYYRQKTMASYGDPAAAKTSYGDVRDAFLYYLANENDGRPFIIAGFSQGSEHALHLIKDVLAEPKIAKRLVAAYLIGWCVTDMDLRGNPQLKPAKGEKDTGVFVSWNTEAKDVTNSALVRAGMKGHTINPLNWKTDGTPAPASLNLGARVGGGFGFGGAKSTPKYCGAEINTKRGTINPIFSKEHPAPSNAGGSFGPGVYHSYDPLFFYENLRKNVQTRITAFTAKDSAAEEEAARAAIADLVKKEGVSASKGKKGAKKDKKADKDSKKKDKAAKKGKKAAKDEAEDSADDADDTHDTPAEDGNGRRGGFDPSNLPFDPSQIPAEWRDAAERFMKR